MTPWLSAPRRRGDPVLRAPLIVYLRILEARGWLSIWEEKGRVTHVTLTAEGRLELNKGRELP